MPYRPPRPSLLPPIAALIRTAWRGDGDLLSLLPAAAFSMDAGELGYSRRSIKLFNHPDLVRQILTDDGSVFPKSDLMVGALEPLIGDSIFVSDGPKWRRQRAMIDPAFSAMRVNLAFGAMEGALDAARERFAAAAAAGTPVSLDLEMSHLAADIICRSVFSLSLDSGVAREVFDDFAVFERGVGQVRVWRLIIDPAWTAVRQSPEVLAACRRIRAHIGTFVDTHANAPEGTYNDIASAVMAARDAETGEGFTREELIDQLGVFFLAGHETTASALTWAMFILAENPAMLARLREEVDRMTGGPDGAIDFAAVKSMSWLRSFFREVLRLYPPITFMPRVAQQATRVGTYRVRKGALIMIAPWTLHRHRRYWRDPDMFDPERFLSGREQDIMPGTYIPFGLGPHTCVGAGFAAVESALICAALTRQFDIHAVAPERVRPAARLTTRPAEEIMIQVKPRQR